MTSIAVIGTGLMGTAIATKLIETGNDVAVWNRSPEKSVVLAERGASVAETLADAVSGSELVFSHLLSTGLAYDLFTALDEVDWNGRILINMSTGTPDEALQFGEFIEARGGHYIDGVISAYPDDIGQSTAIMQYSGPMSAWARIEATVKPLSPAESIYLGEQLDAANVIDPAVTGAVYSVGYGAFLESAAYVASRGISPKLLLPGADKMLDLLRHSIHASVELVDDGPWESDQSTVDAYYSAVVLWRDAMLAAGHRAAYFDALLENLDAARQAGYGELGFHSQFKTARID